MKKRKLFIGAVVLIYLFIFNGKYRLLRGISERSALLRTQSQAGD